MKTKFLGAMIVMVCMASLSVPERMVTGKVTSSDDGSGIPGVNVNIKGTQKGTMTDSGGSYAISIPTDNTVLVFSLMGFATVEVPVGQREIVDVGMTVAANQLEEVVVTGEAIMRDKRALGYAISSKGSRKRKESQPNDIAYAAPQPQWNTEEYDAIHENIFHGAQQNPLSTFSIDVDAASYSNMRRFIQDGQLPPVDAVRIEEMINYFDYEYPQPTGEDPFAIYTEMSAAPWNTKHKLVHIGLQGKKIPTENLPPTNLVFLIDVSGSMDEPNKLPLLKSSFRLLVDQLRQQDCVAIVVYAGAAGMVLPSTPGSNKKAILAALENLEAGGSTAGGAGIRLAYSIARKNFRQGGNNRVILATDGDFNMGESSNGAMEHLIEKEREDGVFLTVLGFGMGNYKDSKMETLADKGNGNYAYIDHIMEAQKVLVHEFGGTLFTIAKDVKLQVEFNPVKVKAYRLIGYEDRVLKNEDFNNDRKDAGELGSGHAVTALYEIIPQGVESEFYKVDDLKYQKQTLTQVSESGEWMTIKFRYKRPTESESRLIVHPLVGEETLAYQTSENFKWSASVAAFGMLLRSSEFLKGYSYNEVLQMARNSKGVDTEGYRAEMIQLVKSSSLMARRTK